MENGFFGTMISGFVITILHSQRILQGNKQVVLKYSTHSVG